MSIEHKNTSEAANLDPAPPVVDANAGEIPNHPIAEFFPMLTGKELDELAEDIAANGQREPGVVWNGMLLDGRNRRLACKLKNIPFKVVTKNFADESKAVAFSISANLRRRHLNESQRAMIGAKLVERWAAVKPQAPSTSVAGEGVSNAGTHANLKSRDKAAEKLNVSARSIQDAIKVRADGAPELVHAVTSGKVSVSAAAQVASLGKDEQVNAVATPGGVRAAAKKIRNDKKSAAAPKDDLKTFSPEHAVVKNRSKDLANDSEIGHCAQLLSAANVAYPDCLALAARLLDGKDPAKAATTWKGVEDFALKMREAYEKLNKGNPSID